jgi:hypothetical protein
MSRSLNFAFQPWSGDSPTFYFNISPKLDASMNGNETRSFVLEEHMPTSDILFTFGNGDERLCVSKESHVKFITKSAEIDLLIDFTAEEARNAYEEIKSKIVEYKNSNKWSKSRGGVRVTSRKVKQHKLPFRFAAKPVAATITTITFDFGDAQDQNSP